jgi:hypothetical protein
MRATVFLLPLMFAASPALAQAQLPPPAPGAIHLPQQLADPATADRVANSIDTLSDALLDLPIGRLKAAIEGRPLAPGEQHMTIRDAERRQDPNFERNFHRQVAEARPMMRQGIRAVNDALPAMVGGLEQVSDALQRAISNMPDPTYPKR